MLEAARSEINQWFEASTAGQIKDFLPPGSVRVDTRCILANALYFKGVWERKFDAQLTQPRAFYLPAGRQVFVTFVSSRQSQYIACCPDWKVLKLLYACHGDEYRRRRFAMYVYLPNERHGLQSILQKMASSPQLLEEGSMDLRSKVPVGNFRVPKFTISYKTEATGLLDNLGLRVPFDHDTADFSQMVQESTKGFVVSNAYHQSFVEVNEEGTEAAAATAINGLYCTSSRVVITPVPVVVVDFVADHPFMYLINEELTGVVVLAGQLVNPSL